MCEMAQKKGNKKDETNFYPCLFFSRKKHNGGLWEKTKWHKLSEEKKHTYSMLHLGAKSTDPKKCTQSRKTPQKKAVVHLPNGFLRNTPEKHHGTCLRPLS